VITVDGKWTRAAIGLVILAMALTFGTLGRKSVWNDEAVSIRSAQRSAAEIWNPGDPSGYRLPLRTAAPFRVHGRDPHPPGYYLLLHAWPWRDGGEAQVRLLSALIGAVAVFLAFLVARRWDRRAGWLAAVLVAWAPLHVWYAQEARMYAFVEFAGLLMALGLALESKRGLALFAAAAAIGCYFDYTAVIVWAVVSGAWLGWSAATRSDAPPRSGAGHIAGWLVASIAGAALAWPLRTGFLEMLESAPGGTVLGNRLGGLIGSPLSPGFVVVALLAAIAGTAAMTWVIVTRPDRRIAAWTVVAIFAAVTLASVAPRLFTVKKVIAPAWPIAALAVAALAPALHGGTRVAAWALVGLSVLATGWMVAAVPKDDWRGVVNHLNATARAGADVVWLDPSWHVVPYDFYRPVVIPEWGGQPALENAARGDGLLWLIVQRRPGSAAPFSPSEAWLDANLPLEQRAEFPRLELRGYRRKP
jgi:mannosyltransferase